MVRKGSSGLRGRKSCLRPWFSEPQSIWKVNWETSSPGSKKSETSPFLRRIPGFPQAGRRHKGGKRMAEDGVYILVTGGSRGGKRSWQPQITTAILTPPSPTSWLELP